MLLILVIVVLLLLARHYLQLLPSVVDSCPTGTACFTLITWRGWQSSKLTLAGVPCPTPAPLPVLYSALHQIQYNVEHVPGVLNVAADAISCNNTSLPTLLSHATQAPVPVSLQEMVVLGIYQLYDVVWAFLVSSVAPSTFASYWSVLNWYHNFCLCFQLPPFLLTSHNTT